MLKLEYYGVRGLANEWFERHQRTQKATLLSNVI